MIKEPIEAVDAHKANYLIGKCVQCAKDVRGLGYYATLVRIDLTSERPFVCILNNPSNPKKKETSWQVIVEDEISQKYRQFHETGFGWITNLGDVIVCDMYQHLLCIKEFEDIDIVIEAKNAIESVTMDCQVLINEGEHPEWHRVDCTQYDYNYKIHKWLYSNGYIRLGVNTHMEQIGVEGVSEAIKNRYQMIQNLLTQYNVENNVEYTLQISHLQENGLK